MRALILVAVAGCNQIYGLDSTKVAPDADTRPDRDHDGIADIEDPCIVTDAEAQIDSDEDGVFDSVDPCLFNDGPNTDGDGDGIPDVCDPFPTLAGDRNRCNMTFQSRELNAALWLARGDEDSLYATRQRLGIFGNGSGVAVENLLGSAATRTFGVAMYVAYAQFPFRAGVWLSAQPQQSPSDVACEVRNDGANVRVRLEGPNPAISPTSSIPDPGSNDTAAIGMYVYLQPQRGGTNVACIVVYESGGTTIGNIVRGHVDVPIGSIGFHGHDGFYAFLGVTMFERDDMPALP